MLHNNAASLDPVCITIHSRNFASATYQVLQEDPVGYSNALAGRPCLGSRSLHPFLALRTTDVTTAVRAVRHCNVREQNAYASKYYRAETGDNKLINQFT
jgi:hypothetical protein